MDYVVNGVAFVLICALVFVDKLEVFDSPWMVWALLALLAALMWHQRESKWDTGMLGITVLIASLTALAATRVS